MSAQTPSAQRTDGRRFDELRPITIQRGFTQHPAGSVLITLGQTKVLCTASIQENVPRWRRGSGMGWVTAEYSLLPGATFTRFPRESVKGKIAGRTQEISRLIGRTLRPAVDLSALGEVTIALDCDVLQADGGTRTAAINGAYVALRDAITVLESRGALKRPALLHSVSAISVGIVNGNLCVDLPYEEDSIAEVDMNIVCTEDGNLIEVQGTAEGNPYSSTQLGAMIAAGQAACATIQKCQKEALAAPYPYPETLSTGNQA